MSQILHVLHQIHVSYSWPWNCKHTVLVDIFSSKMPHQYHIQGGNASTFFSILTTLRCMNSAPPRQLKYVNCRLYMFFILVSRMPAWVRGFLLLSTSSVLVNEYWANLFASALHASASWYFSIITRRYPGCAKSLREIFTAPRKGTVIIWGYTTLNGKWVCKNCFCTNVWKMMR